ncbi:hypothetical protein ACMFMG_003802 [Clarireedia jacksonii]
MFSRSSCCQLSILPRLCSRKAFSKSPLHQQNRTLKLWITATSQKNLPGREILNYENLILPPATSYKLQLLSPDSIKQKDVEKPDSSSRVLTAPSVVSLKDVLDNHLPGGILLARPLNPQNPKQYCLQQAEYQETKAHKRPPKYKAPNPASDCKVLSFGPYHEWSFIQDKLEKARSWLEDGYTVEIGVAWSRKKDEIPNQKAMEEVVDNCLHLRPDVIQKAMPEKSIISISPKTNSLRYAWVISPLRNRRQKLLARILESNFERKKDEVARLDRAGLYEGKRLLPTMKQARGML